MSERMIELQRAKLGLLPAGQSPSGQNSSASPKPSAPSSKQQTPEAAAVASMRLEDSQMERFINRLQRRDDSNQTSAGTTDVMGETIGSTVPTALSRRMLQRQGVGYLDNTVATFVSASADRFLATVLQQAVACRDQRLKGAAMAREAAKHRKRHIQHYCADTDDRKRRKEIIHDAREKVAVSIISKADALKKGGGSKVVTDDMKPKKKTKRQDDAPANGTKLDPATKQLAEEDEEEYDSIDEEEEYYQNAVGDFEWGRSTAWEHDDDDDEEDDTLLLRDIVRPLAAWNFHLTGKEALETDDENPEDDDDDEEKSVSSKAGQSHTQSEATGPIESVKANGFDGQSKPESMKGDDGEGDNKRNNSSAAS